MPRDISRKLQERKASKKRELGKMNGNGKENEPRVMQDAEVDLLLRGKFKCGKMLWPRRDNGTCGYGRCCFLNNGRTGFLQRHECMRPDEVPNCRVQDIYYLDFKTKSDMKKKSKWEWLENAEIRTRDFPISRCVIDDAIEFIRKHYSTDGEWLFGSVTGEIGKGLRNSEYESASVSLLILALVHCSSECSHRRIIIRTLEHLNDFFTKRPCFDITLEFLNSTDFEHVDESTFALVNALFAKINMDDSTNRRSYKARANALCRWFVLQYIKQQFDFLVETYKLLIGLGKALYGCGGGLLSREYLERRSTPTGML